MKKFLKTILFLCALSSIAYAEDDAMAILNKKRAEIEKAEKELQHLEGFLMGIRKKLGNENFVAHAPEAIVARERKKESDSVEKIAALKQTIEELKKK